jgi:hypothetical protein
MKRIIPFLVALTIACNSPESNTTAIHELQDTVKSLNVVALEEVQQEIQNAMRKGDTLMLTPDNLFRLLPDPFPGYAVLDTQHNFISYRNVKLSEAEMMLSNNDQDVKVSLVDFNNSRKSWYDIYTLYSTNYHQDTEQEYACAWSPGVGEQFAWFSRLKDADFTIVKLGFASRFMLTLEVNAETDTLAMREIIRSADWSKLNLIRHD